MSYTVTAVGPQAPMDGFRVTTPSAETALGILAACREAYGAATVRDAAGQVVDMDELIRQAELEAGRTRQELPPSHAQGF